MSTRVRHRVFYTCKRGLAQVEPLNTLGEQRMRLGEHTLRILMIHLPQARHQVAKPPHCTRQAETLPRRYDDTLTEERATQTWELWRNTTS